MWDDREHSSKSRLTDEEKREIAESVKDLFTLDVGRGTITAVKRLCWTLGSACLGYLIAQAEKWLK